MSPDPDTRPDDLTIDGDVFVVLVNDEDQHSLWPAAKAIPEGWSVVHPAASREASLAWVDRHWTDMRPPALRQAMARDARGT